MQYFSPQPKNITIKLKRHELVELKRKLLKTQSNRCHHCGAWIRGWSIADLHHIKNRSLGGGDTEDNLVILCRACHRLAHDGKAIIIK